MDTNITSSVDVKASPDSKSIPDVNASLDKLFGLEGGSGDFKPGDNADGRTAFDDVKGTDGDSSKAPQPRDITETLKLLQSERDKATARAQKLEAEAKEKENLAAFIEALYKDKQVRLAFLSETEPELIKPKDPYAFINESLKKEFGEDFTPDRDEIHLAGTRSWLYNKRAEQLLQDVSQKATQAPASIKDLLKQREQQKVEQLKAAEAEKRETMEKLKWDDAAWQSFTNWMKSSQTIHFGQIFDRLMKVNQGQPPYVANQPGFNRNTSNEFENLKKFFG